MSEKGRRWLHTQVAAVRKPHEGGHREYRIYCRYGGCIKKCVDGLKDTAEHLTRLETKLIMGLSDANVRFSRNGSAAHIPGNISLSFPGYSGEALLHRLDLMGICVSTGSACNSRETQISHVLQAIKLEPELAKGTIRLSLGKNNTEGDIDEIVDALLRILK